MRKLILFFAFSLSLISLAEAADIQRGKTFTSNDTVENTDLHSLVDDATITDIAQADIVSNSGLVIRSGTQPSDTDAAWYDTANGLFKVYDGSSWVIVPDDNPTFTTITTTGAGTIGGALAVTGTTTLSNTLTIANDVTITGHLFTSGGQFGNWVASRAEDTNYLAEADGFLTVIGDNGTSGELIGYSDASTPPTVERVGSGYSGGSDRRIGITLPVKKGHYYKYTDVESQMTSLTGYWIPMD